MSKFLIAGIPRSGSTALFNVVRLLCSPKSVYSCWLDDFNAGQAVAAEVSIVKVHEPTQRFSDYLVVTSHRDLRDIARSAVRMGFVDERGAVDYAVECTKKSDYWSPRAEYDMNYERYMKSPEVVVGEIAAALKILTSAERCAEIAREVQSIEPPKGNKFDPTTLLHPRHRDGGGSLPKKVIHEIEERCGEWLAKNGYGMQGYGI